MQQHSHALHTASPHIDFLRKGGGATQWQSAFEILYSKAGSTQQLHVKTERKFLKKVDRADILVFQHDHIADPPVLGVGAVDSNVE